MAGISKNFYFMVAAILVSSICLQAEIYTRKDVKIFQSKVKWADQESLRTKMIGERIAAVGKTFLGSPYAEKSIDSPEKEELVIDLREFDCVTFVENVLALARVIKRENPSFRNFENEILFGRYRKGRIKDYPSRLNYFSDWIAFNAERGAMEDITASLGGEPVKFKTGYMSAHPDHYRQLRDHPEFLETIRIQEEDINIRAYHAVPKERVDEAEGKIENGDVIAITTTIPGLDVVHVGIAVKDEDGRVHLLHASMKAGVTLSSQPLASYLASIKSHTGIMVIRAIESKP